MHDCFKRKAQTSRQAACLMGQRIAPPSRKSTVEEPPSAEGKHKHRNNQHPDQEKNRRFKAAVSLSYQLRHHSHNLFAPLFKHGSHRYQCEAKQRKRCHALESAFHVYLHDIFRANRQAVVKRSIFVEQNRRIP